MELQLGYTVPPKVDQRTKKRTREDFIELNELDLRCNIFIFIAGRL